MYVHIQSFVTMTIQYGYEYTEESHIKDEIAGVTGEKIIVHASLQISARARTRHMITSLYNYFNL